MKEVFLYGKKAAGRVALVDEGDYRLVTQHRWNVRDYVWHGRHYGPYAITNARMNGEKRTLFMHTLIMGLKGVDHKDGNGLNNQRWNLRPATQQQNVRNQRGSRNSSSQFKGVFYRRDTGKWRAGINVGNHMLWLGQYESEVDAARVYDSAAREYFGEFAWLNFPNLESVQLPLPRVSHSEYRGVYPSHSKWMARFGSTAPNRYIGSFDTELEAAQAYDTAAKLRFGSDTKLNFPEHLLPGQRSK